MIPAGRPARPSCPRPRTLAKHTPKQSGAGAFRQRFRLPPLNQAGGFFELKEIARTRQAPAESRRQPGLAAPRAITPVSSSPPLPHPPPALSLRLPPILQLLALRQRQLALDPTLLQIDLRRNQ